MGRGVLLQHEERLSVIRREGDDAIVNFGAARQECSGLGTQCDRYKTMGNLDALLELEVA